MPAALRCPTCSAPLDVPPEHATTTRCTYCGAGVLLAERGGHVEAAAQQQRHADAIGEVLAQLRAGSKIGAIRVYRERFGVGVAEAKHAVERIEAGQPAGSLPVSSGKPASAVGCAALLVVLGAGAGVLLMQRSAETPAPQSPPGTASPARSAASAEEDAGPPAFAQPVLRFGAEGTGAGRFQDARSVAVDGTGRIYVAEYTGGRVQVFDSAGTFLTQWMADERMPLLDMEADRGGTVYVVQSGRIRRREGATGRALQDVPRPRGASFDDVALALDGSLWTVSGLSQLMHLGADGTVRRTIDLRQAVDEDASPERVAVAGNGHLYVLDRWSGAVYHLDAEGKFVDRFGGRGEGAEALSSPNDLAIDGRGRVYVSDLGVAVRVFDPDGRLLGSFAPNTVVFGIAFNDRDELFAAHRNQHQVVKYRLSQ